MLKNTKPLVLSLVGLVLSSTNAYALNVTVPNLKPGFEFNVAALWLRPGASNLNYVIYNKELPAQTPTWAEHEINPKWSTGFELGIGYIFPNCEGQDIRLYWTHLSTNDSASTLAPSPSFFLGPDYEIGPAGIPIRQANGTAKFNYDVVNLDVGQYAAFGPHVTLRFFGGLSGGYLREEVISNYTGTTLLPPFVGPFSLTQDSTSKFKGIGPRFGIAANYFTNCGLGFVGDAAVSALIGSIDTISNFTSSAQELLVIYDQRTNRQFISDQSVYQVVPGLDAKLGIYYQHDFCNKTSFKVTVGYRAAVYANAISQYQPATLVTPLETGGIFVATMEHRLSNYSVQGPFLDFSLTL